MRFAMARPFAFAPSILANALMERNSGAEQAYPPFFYAHPPRTADARGFPPFFALWRYNASIICP